MSCALCGRHVPRLWWQRGILRPLPVCRPGDSEECQRRARILQGLVRALDIEPT